MFSKILLDHFQNPRNAGELPGATTRVEVTNPVCGDVLQLAVISQNGVISDVRFLCRGCSASIACASLLTQKIKTCPRDELSSLSPQALAQSLGGLPPASFHAAQLACDGLQALLRAVPSESSE